MSVHILVLEDEIDFQEGLVELLNIEGFKAHGVSNLGDLKAWLFNNPCDILILDRNLPDGDGLDALKCIKNPNRTGSIVLTCEGLASDRIAGINANADYYLVKPFPMDELIAIIKRLQRRISTNSDELLLWTLDLIRWELKSPCNLEIELTKSEFALMSCFVDKPGLALSRDAIIEGLGFNPTDYDNRRLEVLIRRLRKKIEDSGVAKFPLQTVYGVGIVFNEILRVK